jgi:uncharacterized protein (DUF433 family)
MKSTDFEDVTREDIENVIDTYIVLHRNAERNRNILKRRLIDGLTHDQLANEFDLSVQSVQKILYKYEEVVFKHLS